MRSRLIMVFATIAVVACGGSSNKQDIDAPEGGGSDGATTDGSGTDSGGGIDAAGTHADGGIGVTCGATVCTGTQECCIGAGASTCVDQGTCTTATFQCDGPEDCEANQVCCLGAGGAGGGGAECKLATQCQSNACHFDTDCGGNTPSCCPIGNSAYSACLAQCPP
jgi:hypothetical protein